MPPTPVDDHTEEFEQLAGLSALDILEADELVRFEAHAAHCEHCRLMVLLDREALALAAPEMEPSPDFKARLLRRAAQELASADAGAGAGGQVSVAEAPRPEPTPLRRQPTVITLWRRSPWASALAAVFVVGLVSAGAFAYENQVVASYALTGSLHGTAVVHVRRSGAAELDLNGVDDPPAGLLYEAWIITPEGQPLPVGVTATGNSKIPLDRIENGSTIAITQEARRVDLPTSAPVMVTVVRL